jgi:integrase/recombinase XerD
VQAAAHDVQRERRVTDQELVDAFLGFKRINRGRAKRTLQIYSLALARLIQFMGDRRILNATQEELIAFTGPWLHKRSVIASSRKPYVAAVREFYKWLQDRGHTRHNPASDVPYPATGRKLPRTISLTNAEKLMWAPDFHTFEGVRDGAMLTLLAGCGIRVSGLVRLNTGDVVEQLIDGKARLFIRVLEKKDRERLVPVPAEADLQLRVYLEHPELKEIDRALPSGDHVLFVTTRNRMCPPHLYTGERRRFDRRSINEMIMKYGRAHGIPDAQLHPHAMRHLYGTELAEEDVDLIVRQQLLGHQDPKSTEIYTHLATRKLFHVVDGANPLGKMRTPVSDILKRL